MKIVKSTGFTKSEKLLRKICDQTFLDLWSYPNPYNDEGKELCDLIVVYEDYIFIFFDKTIDAFSDATNALNTEWSRWKRRAIDPQIKATRGAEKYIKSGRKIFLDAKKIQELPIPIDFKNVRIFRIVVANGAERACKKYFPENITGSLAISYSDNNDEKNTPFFVYLERNNPVHVFDSHSLPVVLQELDTIYDFSNYLIAKEKAIKRYKVLTYCGEEDLLAHYYCNYDVKRKHHYIGTSDHLIDAIMIAEGEWQGLQSHPQYEAKRAADRISYLWDSLLRKTSQNALDGTLLGDVSFRRDQSAIHVMAKEPRFVRRALSDRMIKAVEKFSVHGGERCRMVSLLPSFYSDTAYVFLQVGITDSINESVNGREFRRKMLEIACGVAKNKNRELMRIVGIAIDGPVDKVISNSEDFILLNCKEWTHDDVQEYKRLNTELRLFETANLRAEIINSKVFPDVPREKPVRDKVKRNQLCPCGSGRKFKKCCL